MYQKKTSGIELGGTSSPRMRVYTSPRPTSPPPNPHLQQVIPQGLIASSHQIIHKLSPTKLGHSKRSVSKSYNETDLQQSIVTRITEGRDILLDRSNHQSPNMQRHLVRVNYLGKLRGSNNTSF
jgi:hypothetical protein